MTDAIIDTNVGVVANGDHPEASDDCRENCIRKLQSIYNNDKVKLILDNNDEVFLEYRGKLSLSGQPNTGDVFMKWVHNNKDNPDQCIKYQVLKDNDTYIDFPDDPNLMNFDRSDRKFAILSILSETQVTNATDSDWHHYQEPLNNHGVFIEFLCPDYQFKEKK